MFLKQFNNKFLSQLDQVINDDPSDTEIIKDELSSPRLSCCSGMSDDHSVKKERKRTPSSTEEYYNSNEAISLTNIKDEISIKEESLAGLLSDDSLKRKKKNKKKEKFETEQNHKRLYNTTSSSLIDDLLPDCSTEDESNLPNLTKKKKKKKHKEKKLDDQTINSIDKIDILDPSNKSVPSPFLPEKKEKKQVQSKLSTFMAMQPKKSKNDTCQDDEHSGIDVHITNGNKSTDSYKKKKLSFKKERAEESSRVVNKKELLATSINDTNNIKEKSLSPSADNSLNSTRKHKNRKSCDKIDQNNGKRRKFENDNEENIRSNSSHDNNNIVDSFKENNDSFDLAKKRKKKKTIPEDKTEDECKSTVGVKNEISTDACDKELDRKIGKHFKPKMETSEKCKKKKKKNTEQEPIVSDEESPKKILNNISNISGESKSKKTKSNKMEKKFARLLDDYLSDSSNENGSPNSTRNTISEKDETIDKGKKRKRSNPNVKILDEKLIYPKVNDAQNNIDINDLPIDYERIKNECGKKSDKSMTNNSKCKNVKKSKNSSKMDDECSDEDDDTLIDYQLNDEEKHFLDNLDILLPYPCPPLHLVQTTVTNPLKGDKLDELRKLAIKIKVGTYTKKEDQQIKQNFETFCELHDIKPNPRLFLTLKHPGCKILSLANRLKFVRFMAHGLETRTLKSVYKRFQRIYSVYKTGRFSKMESKKIMDYIYSGQSRTPFSDLSKVLNRPPLAIENHYDMLIGEKVPIRWTDDYIRKFIKCLLEVTNSPSIEEFRKRIITGEEYRLISEKLDIPVAKLRKGWLFQVYPRTFIDRSLDVEAIAELKKKLVNYLCRKNKSDWRDVNWGKVAKRFPGFSPQKICGICKEMVHTMVPQHLRKDLKASLIYLRDEYIPKHKLSGKVLRKVNVE